MTPPPGQNPDGKRHHSGRCQPFNEGFSRPGTAIRRSTSIRPQPGADVKAGCERDVF